MQSETMLSGKSFLNPYATPYVPLSKKYSGKSFEDEDKDAKDVFVVDENIDKDVGPHVTDSFCRDYEIDGFEKAHLSEESSSKMVHHIGGFDDEGFVAEKQSTMDDLTTTMESLSSMFPNLSMDSIADVFTANHGDLDETIDMLEQLEDEGDGSGPSGVLPETLEIGTDLDPSF